MGEGRGDGPGLRLWRISWLLFLIGQGVLASAWWWLAPGGFGPGHPRFWLNRVAAPTIAVAAIATLWALRGERWGPLRLLLPAWPAAWAGMAMALCVEFPARMAGLGLVPLVVAVGMGLAAAASRPLWDSCRGRRAWRRLLLAAGTATWVAAALLLCLMSPLPVTGPLLSLFGIVVAMGLAAIRPWRTGTSDRRRPGALVAVVGGSALAGAALAAALGPPPANTHPLDVAIATVDPFDASNRRIPTGSVPLVPGATIQRSDGSLLARFGPVAIRVQPLLRFLSGSPDGAPVVLVPAGERAGPLPRLRDGWRTGERSYRLSYEFRGQGPATLLAMWEPVTGAIILDAACRLERPVYSHLNGFCDVEVEGHRRLSLGFSPCPGTPIEVQHFGYPAGRPARFAFVSADRTFRVVEAASGEKGPFRTLARGRLRPEDVLTITFHDRGRPIARLSLDDFAAQADTSLSPTAGWGVPVNAIEFSLAEDRPASPAAIFVTLAGTSVGRGWDCVGHRAGTYRNRLRLEPVDGAASEHPPEASSSGPHQGTGLRQEAVREGLLSPLRELPRWSHSRTR